MGIDIYRYTVYVYGLWVTDGSAGAAKEQAKPDQLQT